MKNKDILDGLWVGIMDGRTILTWSLFSNFAGYVYT